MATVNEEIMDRVLVRVLQLQRLVAGEKRVLMRALRDVESGLVAAIATHDPGGVDRMSARQLREKRLLAEAQDLIRVGFRGMRDDFARRLRELASAETKWMVATSEAVVGVDVMGTALSGATIRSVASDTLIQGAQSAEWWGRQAQRTANAFADRVRVGVLRGDTTPEIIRTVRGTAAAGYSDGIGLHGPGGKAAREAEALVRTSVQSVSNHARLETLAENADVVEEVEWVATLDNRTTLTCMALHGKRWRLPDYKPVGHDMEWPGPTAHWNCFLGSVAVDSPAGASKLYRRPYSGELVTVETKNGRAVTGTLNHPVLTPTGWKALGDIHSGDEVICQTGNHPAVSLWNPQNQSVQPTFKELVEAASKLGGVRASEMPVANPDFHGDGTDGEIGQVWADRLLWHKLNAARREFTAKVPFNVGYLDVAKSFPGFGAGNQTTARGRLAAQRSVGRSHVGLLAARPASVQVFASGAGHTRIQTPASQGGDADADLIGNGTGRQLVTDVEVDRVSVVRRRKAVSVWVHNLETATGWYFAGGIASHNCRSTQVPVVKSWDELSEGRVVQTESGGRAGLQNAFEQKLREMGMPEDQIKRAVANARASMDGQVPVATTFDEWLKGKSATVQEQLLGKGRAQLFREGKVTLRQLVSQDGRPLRLDQLPRSG